MEPFVTPVGSQIRDSNRYTLMSTLKLVLRRCVIVLYLQHDRSTINCDVIDLGIAPDNYEDLAAKLQQGIDSADVLITSGLL